MDAPRIFFFLTILCLVIPVVEDGSRNSSDIVQDIEEVAILDEVMETATTQIDNGDNYKTDDSKCQINHTSSYIFMVQSKEMKDAPVYTDGELESFQPTCPSSIPPRMPQMTNK